MVGQSVSKETVMARVESAQVKELPEKSKSIDKSKSDKDLAKIGGTGGPRRHTA